MANYADTRALTLQSQLTELMNMPEFKKKPSAVIQMLLSNGKSLIGSKARTAIDTVKSSDQNVVEVSILNDTSTTSGTGRLAAHTGTIGDSTKATLAFVTRTESFKYSIKQADRDGVFTLQEMIGKRMLSAMDNLVDVYETYYLAWLNTNKSQVVNTPSLGTWDGTNFIYGVDDGDQEIMFQRFKGFMREQYLKGEMQLVSNEFVTQKGEYLSQQGGGNSTNLGWQLSNITNYASSELANFTGYQGQGYIIPVGTVGLETWIPRINREGYGMPNEIGGAYYKIDYPRIPGLTFAVHEYAVASDNQAAAGESQDINFQVEVSLDSAPVKAIESTTNSSPIYKVGVLTA